MKVVKLCWAMVALFAFACVHVYSASLGDESFDAGFNGWTNGVSTNKWVATNQLLRLTFPGGGIPLPLTSTIEAGSGATGGAFTGSFPDAGIEAVGFSFLCENVKPSDLKIEIVSGTNTVLQELSTRLSGVGTWNHFLCPVTGPESVRWVGFPPASIAEISTNVTRITLRLLNNSSVSPQNFQLDNFFLARRPAAASVAQANTNVTIINWTNLRTNFTYRMETAATVDGIWTNLATFTPTNTAMDLTHTNSANPAFYRLFIP